MTARIAAARRARVHQLVGQPAPRLGRHLISLTESGAALMRVRSRRRWVDGSDLGFFELVGVEFGHASFHVFAVRPQVVDAQALIEQLLAAAKRGHSVAFLDLVTAGVVRPLTTARIVHEVDRRLPPVAAEAGFDPAVVAGLWKALRARLRVVQIALPVPYPAELDVRAPSDIDIAQLATMLGVRAVSKDNDLRACDLAAEFNLPLANAMGELASGECAGLIGLAVTAEGTAALLDLARWFARQAARYPLLAMFAVAGIALVIQWLRRQNHVRRLVSSEEWRPLLRRGIAVVGRTLQVYYELSLQMPEPITPNGQLPLAWNLARVLASGAGPMSAREVSAALALDEVAAAEGEVLHELRLHATLFARNGRGQWQFGASIPAVASPP